MDTFFEKLNRELEFSSLKCIRAYNTGQHLELEKGKMYIISNHPHLRSPSDTCQCIDCIIDVNRLAINLFLQMVYLSHPKKH